MRARNLAAISASDADNVGLVVGSVIATIIVIGILILAVICVVKAFTRKTKGWIISGIAGAVVIAVPVFLVVAGLISGSTSALHQSDLPRLKQIASTLALPEDHPGDLAFPLRKQAWQMTVTLIYCDVSNEEACDIALHHLPGAAVWWTNNLFPHLSLDNQNIVAKELDRFKEIVRSTDRAALGPYLCEKAILRIIQQEKHFTSAQIFDLWQAGILHQSEDWWNAQMDGLPVAKQEQIRKMRRDPNRD
jgi:hypothetical protein